MDRASEKILLLPLASLGADESREDHYLTRQMPILVRNAYERKFPGKVVAVPLATTVDGRRKWIVNTQAWQDDAAIAFAAERHYAAVCFGTVERTQTPGVYAIFWRALDVETRLCHFDKKWTGDVLTLGRAMIQALANVIEMNENDAAALFQPDTKNAAAYAAYQRGLDTLLCLRSDDMTLERPEEALRPFEEAVRLDPAFNDALTAGMSCALQSMEPSGRDLDIDRIIGALESWIAVYPADPRIHAVLAEILIHKKRLADAANVLARGLSSCNPAPRDLIRRAGDVMVDLGRHAEALEFYERAEAMAHDRLVVERMATICVMLQKEERARTHLARAIEDEPERTDLLARLALLDMRAGDDENMWKNVAAIFRTHAGPSETDFTKVHSILAQRKAPASVKDAIRSWHPPETFSAPSRVLLVRALRMAGALLEARLGAERLKRAPLAPEIRSSLARERLNMSITDFDDRFAETAKVIMSDATECDRELLDRSVEEEPDFWPARFLRGLLSAKTGDLPTAIGEFQTVIDQQPKNDIVWYTRGLYLLKLGRHEEATAHFERAISINAKDGDYHLHLAVSQAHMKLAAEARASLARALALRPNHPENTKIAAEVERALG